MNYSTSSSRIVCRLLLTTQSSFIFLQRTHVGLPSLKSHLIFCFLQAEQARTFREIVGMRQPFPVGSVKIDGTWVLGELDIDDGRPFLVGTSVKVEVSLPSSYGRFIACGLVDIGEKGGQVVCRMNCRWAYSLVCDECMKEDENRGTWELDLYLRVCQSLG